MPRLDIRRLVGMFMQAAAPNGPVLEFQSGVCASSERDFVEPTERSDGLRAQQANLLGCHCGQIEGKIEGKTEEQRSKLRSTGVQSVNLCSYTHAFGDQGDHATGL